eukprot:1686989-Ditylum_brightwellii.AAC.1
MMTLSLHNPEFKRIIKPKKHQAKKDATQSKQNIEQDISISTPAIKSGTNKIDKLMIEDVEGSEKGNKV